MTFPSTEGPHRRSAEAPHPVVPDNLVRPPPDNGRAVRSSGFVEKKRPPPKPNRQAGVAVTNYFNKTLVAAYKIVGFTLLGIILFGLFAYVALNGLFFLHSGWISPAVIAPSDLRVIELRARLAHEVWDRQKVEAERARVASDLKHAERTAAMEEQYQQTFQEAVSKNATAQQSRLWGFRALREEVREVHGKLERATKEFARERSQSVASARAANLIDNEAKVTEDFRLAELDARRIQLQQQEAQLSAQLAQLAHEASALKSVARGPRDATPATFEALQLKRSYLNSVLEKDRAVDEVQALESAKSALDKAIEGYDAVISIIQESPLLLAASGELTVAFAPYENLSSINEGDPVYACYARVIGCRVVGAVGKTIEGEVTAKHPVYGTDLRGKFVRLELTEQKSAEEVVLHVKRPPLFF